MVDLCLQVIEKERNNWLFFLIRYIQLTKLVIIIFIIKKIGGRDKTLRLWDLENLASTVGPIHDNLPMHTFETPHSENIQVAGFNPQYMMMVTGADDLVSINFFPFLFLFSSYDKNDPLFPGTS